MKHKKILAILFVLYILILLYLTLFKNYLGRNYGIYDINLIPFKNIYIIISDFLNNEVSLKFVTRNILGNIIAFTPFGFFLISLFKVKNLKKYTLISLMFIVLIESLQLIFKIGFFDIDDIILNYLGIFLIYLILNKETKIQLTNSGKKVKMKM